MQVAPELINESKFSLQGSGEDAHACGATNAADSRFHQSSLRGRVSAGCELAVLNRAFQLFQRPVCRRTLRE